LFDVLIEDIFADDENSVPEEVASLEDDEELYTDSEEDSS
jgi:hypothetical protein